MTNENPRLLKALQQKERAEKTIKKIKAQENAESRKLDTRRKILLGVMLEKMLIDGCVTPAVFGDYLEKFMKNERDHKVFDGYLDGLKHD
jgi:F0F1-type ATP synthase assembly protein I